MLHRPVDLPSSTRMLDFAELLAGLRRRRDDLQRDLKRVETTIKSMENAQRTLTQEALELLSGQIDSVQVPGARRERGVLPPADIARLVRETLLDHGRPMKRGQIVRELERREVPLVGKDKNKNVGTILWRHRNEFVHLDKLGYWVRGAPLAGVYDPATDDTN